MKVAETPFFADIVSHLVYHACVAQCHQEGAANAPSCYVDEIRVYPIIAPCIIIEDRDDVDAFYPYDVVGDLHNVERVMNCTTWS